MKIPEDQDLKTAIQKLIQANEAKQDITDEYGTYYQVIGELEGVISSPVKQLSLRPKGSNR